MYIITLQLTSIINVFREQRRIRYLVRSPCTLAFSCLLDLGLIVSRSLCSLSGTRSRERFDKTKNWRIRGTCPSAVLSTNWTEQARQHCPPTAREAIHSLLVLSFSHSVAEKKKKISHNINPHTHSLLSLSLKSTLSKLLSDQLHQHQSLSRCSLWQLSSTSIVSCYHWSLSMYPQPWFNRLNRSFKILRQAFRVLCRN